MKTCIVYIPCSWKDVPRSFFESFLAMTSYTIQKTLIEKYNVQLKFMVSDTFPIDRNRNQAIERCVERYKADFVFFCDADQVFPSNTLLNLFERISDEYPVVSGNYHKKEAPHQSVVGWYSSWEPKVEAWRPSLTEMGFVTESGQQCLFYLSASKWESDKPFQIDVSGAGCLLVDISVFGKLKQPYFKYFDSFLTGDYNLDGISEDMWFFCQLKKAGVKVLCDPRVQVGHLTEREVTFMDQGIQPDGIHIIEPTYMEASK